MVHKTLTDRTLQALASPHQTYVWDTMVRGFGVRVGPRRKVFVIVRNGRRKTLGIYGALSLKDARRQAQTILLGSFGPDPSPKTGAAIEEYLRSIDARPRTVREYERLLTKHLKPFTNKKLGDITKAHVIAITDALRSTPTECLHAHAAMRALFNWAAARSLIPRSPMDNLPAPVSPTQRDRLLSDSEVTKIWHAATGDFGRLIKICLLTGMRRSEVAAIRSDWIQADTIVVPAAIAKNGRECVLPITDVLRPLLDPLPLKRFNWSHVKNELDQASACSDWVIHDTRRFFSSLHARIRTPIDVQEALLNHVTGSRTAIQRVYDRYDRLEEKRAAMLAYVDALKKIIDAPDN